MGANVANIANIILGNAAPGLAVAALCKPASTHSAATHSDNPIASLASGAQIPWLPPQNTPKSPFHTLLDLQNPSADEPKTEPVETPLSDICVTDLSQVVIPPAFIDSSLSLPDLQPQPASVAPAELPPLASATLPDPLEPVFALQSEGTQILPAPLIATPAQTLATEEHSAQLPANFKADSTTPALPADGAEFPDQPLAEKPASPELIELASSSDEPQVDPSQKSAEIIGLKTATPSLRPDTPVNQTQNHAEMLANDPRPSESAADTTKDSPSRAAASRRIANVSSQNLSSDSSARLDFEKSAVTDIDITTQITKESAAPQTEAQSAAALTAENVITPFDPQPRPIANTTPARDLNPTPDFHSDIPRQVHESVTVAVREGRDQVTIRLSPPELGKVAIKLEHRDDGITARIEVARPETRVDIQQSLPDLIRTLASSGVQIKRFEVTLAENPDPDNFARRPFADQQNHWTQHQDSSNYTPQHAHGPRARWLTDLPPAASAEPSRPQFIAAGSINLLI